MPGFVDAHVHLMEPPSEHREDWAHGSAAAAASGVTTILEHTHDGPVLSVADLEEKREYLSGRSIVDYGLGAHVFPESIKDIADVWAAGAAFLKAFTCTTHGVPGLDSDTLLQLFTAAADAAAVCLVHAEAPRPLEQFHVLSIRPNARCWLRLLKKSFERLVWT